MNTRNNNFTQTNVFAIIEDELKTRLGFIENARDVCNVQAELSLMKEVNALRELRNRLKLELT